MINHGRLSDRAMAKTVLKNCVHDRIFVACNAISGHCMLITLLIGLIIGLRLITNVGRVALIF